MSSSLKRHEKFYPDPKTKKLLNAYSKSTETSKSSIVINLLKEKFNSLPESERQRLLSNDK